MSLDQSVNMLKLVHRIEWLETEVRRYAAEAVMANTRIEALERALQFILIIELGCAGLPAPRSIRTQDND